MQLPRRVPWTSIAELDQICAWIFSDENDTDSKLLAIQRLAAWKTITSLPHAIESTLALLIAIQEDDAPRSSFSFSMSQRQNYAAAIIRLVNGLVDPLQSGVYARSIASIAEQLGLPLWLVELRHSATHEDLPSLELLQEGARQAMAWLFQNYWLPTISPFTPPKHYPTMRPLAPVLNEYKRLVKATTRDQTLKNTYQQSITKATREVERWIGEAKVAADIGLDANDSDFKETFALGKLADELLQKGVLVPVSKKKRIFPTDSFYPPVVSIQVWGPFLQQMNTSHPEMPTVLVNRIISILLTDVPTTPDSTRANSSFDMCIARWAAWIVDNCITEEPDAPQDTAKRDLVISLLNSMGPKMATSKPIPVELLRALCHGDERFEIVLAHLTSTNAQPSTWSSEAIDIMTGRLAMLLDVGSEERQAMDTSEPSQSQSEPAEVQSHVSAPGWTLLSDPGWKPSPLGVYYAPN